MQNAPPETTKGARSTSVTAWPRSARHGRTRCPPPHIERLNHTHFGHPSVGEMRGALADLRITPRLIGQFRVSPDPKKTEPAARSMVLRCISPFHSVFAEHCHVHLLP